MNQVATPAPSSSGADFVKSRRSSIIAAIFLMATSAIGPGFITQTATFTTKLGAAFAFGILASVIIDFVVQLNVWRMIALSRRNASALANAALPGSGHVLALLVIFGGLVFNVGNIAGAGLGLSALLGLPAKWGGLISAALAVGIFASSRAGAAVDRLIIWLGLLMIGMTAYVAFVSGRWVRRCSRWWCRSWWTGRPSPRSWAAAITSVIGAAYTSMSFLSAFKGDISERARNRATVVFIAVSLAVFLLMGTAPAALLVFAGGFNGLILPLGMTIFMIIGWRRADLLGGVPYPKWLLVLGTAVCVLTWYMGVVSVGPIFRLLAA